MYNLNADEERLLEKREIVKRGLAKCCKEKAEVYFYDNMNDKKMRKAMESYASRINSENILGFVNESRVGAKYGTIFADKGIYYNKKSGISGFISYEDSMNEDSGLENIFDSETYCLENVCELIQDIKKVDKSTFSEWIENGLGYVEKGVELAELIGEGKQLYHETVDALRKSREV